ncbi:MAG: hypothetical protein M3256_15670 [Actinomycetota bacterium]|nr:hypothetical protein [Actinomycetota bacterium]
MEGTTPVLLVGEGVKVEGEIWLTNPTGSTIVLTAASLSVTLTSGTETGTIQLAPETSIPSGGTKRLLINTGMQPFTPGGSYSATIDLTTSAGVQSIPATFFVVTVLRVGLVADRQVFTGVTAGGKVNGSVVVLNKGNVPVTVGAIADEPLLEVGTTARVLGVGAGGVVAVQPAAGLVPLAGKATFTNATPVIPVGGWANVTFQLTAPAGLGSNLHVRVLPRIATERFAVDLLTS